MAKKPRYVVVCPNGHTKGLQVRCVVDFPAIACDDGRTVLVDESKPDIQEMGGSPGIDCGLWCPTCEEWSDEDDAVRPASEVAPRRERRSSSSGT